MPLSNGQVGSGAHACVIPLSHMSADVDLDLVLSGRQAELRPPTLPQTIAPKACIEEESRGKKAPVAGVLPDRGMSDSKRSHWNQRGASTLEEMARHLDHGTKLKEATPGSSPKPGSPKSRAYPLWLPRWSARKSAEERTEDDCSTSYVPLSSADGARNDEEPDWVFALRWGGRGAGALHAQLQAQPPEPRLMSDGTQYDKRRLASSDVSCLV
ncbi:MAG: hypothetical protein SGPRY_000896 [Prymnesium sp.]